mmetsp:Transcript_2149/g.3289  ORF Transcript_2149/g.3289 Transcript_2149/m.3289 type:complete len:207 (+) Transcript_2149:138-758(+)
MRSFSGGTTSRTRMRVCSTVLGLPSSPPTQRAWKFFQVPPAALCMFSRSKTGPPKVVPSTRKIRLSLVSLSSGFNISSEGIGDDTSRHGPTKYSLDGYAGRSFLGLRKLVGVFAITSRLVRYCWKIGFSSMGGKSFLGVVMAFRALTLSSPSTVFRIFSLLGSSSVCTSSSIEAVEDSSSPEELIAFSLMSSIKFISSSFFTASSS